MNVCKPGDSTAESFILELVREKLHDKVDDLVDNQLAKIPDLEGLITWAIENDVAGLAAELSQSPIRREPSARSAGSPTDPGSETPAELPDPSPERDVDDPE